MTVFIFKLIQTFEDDGKAIQYVNDQTNKLIANASISIRITEEDFKIYVEPSFAVSHEE